MLKTETKNIAFDDSEAAITSLKLKPRVSSILANSGSADPIAKSHSRQLRFAEPQVNFCCMMILLNISYLKYYFFDYNVSLLYI